METKEFKIQVPDGYEIDKGNSTFDCIKFKPIKKKLAYDDVAKELFKGRNKYIHTFFTIDGWKESVCASDKQVKKLIAINKLMNVAAYLNGDWHPDFNDDKQKKFFITDELHTNMCVVNLSITFVYFKSQEAAQKAIDILGEDTIRTALSADW